MAQDFVKQDTALESMRESDFDCYSAYGEVIDNSIQAGANEIRIHFKPKEGAPGKIAQVLFADNGQGMDKDLLHKCLKLGHSSRYNDRNGIGRFGVGMTLGAIHECRRIEVYSKTELSEWLYTYIDLDEIKEGTLEYIPEPIHKDPSTDKNITGLAEFIKDSGTLIVWRKYDRQIESLDNIIDESHFWIGRTFRKFIWGVAKSYDYPVKISINNKDVKAFDPLFVTKDKTGFEEEPAAESLVPSIINWNIPHDVLKENSELGAISKILINMSFLPEEYRRSRGAGGDQFAKDRGIDRNEGVSIMRSDREVFFGLIPHANALNGSNDGDRNITRFIGCEISFEPELDREFEVKNIKRGCVPARELKKEIIEKLAPTFRSYREKIRNRWNELDRESQVGLNEENTSVGIEDTHTKTINQLKKANVKAKIDKSKLKSESENENIGRKINPEIDTKIQDLVNQLKENGITIVEREFIGDSFIDIEHGNGLKSMIYNTNSIFYKKYKSILDQLKSENLELAESYKILIDLIFVGYLLAESNIDPNRKMDGIDFISDIRTEWSRQLRDVLKEWNP